MLPARLLLDVVRSLPADRSRSSCAPPSRTSSSSRATRPSTSAPCAPRTSRPSRAGRGGRRHGPGARVRRDDPQGRQLGLARRDAPGPDRHPRLGAGRELRMVATDSYRLSVKETHARAAAATAASRPTCRRGRCRSSRASRQQATTRSSRVGVRAEPGRLRGRRRRAVVAADRRPVPELPPAAARDATSTSCGSPATSSTDVVRRISLLAQKNAPLRLAFSRGRADGVGPDAGHRRGARDAAGAVPGRAVRDRLQPGVPARRAGERRVGRRWC